jgi:type VI secretion system protein VasJ
MSTLNALLSACQTEQGPLLAATRERVAQWDSWLQPLSGASPAGEDPGYDDDFQQMREEVNKLSGADTELICRLQRSLTTDRERYPCRNLLLLGEAAPRRRAGAG